MLGGGWARGAPEKWKKRESPGCVFQVSSCIWYLRARVRPERQPCEQSLKNFSGHHS